MGTPTVNDNSLETGGAFTLSATVSNDGDGAAAATTLRYYRSTDATITTSDTSVGTDAVGALAASGTSAESISLTAPLTAGTYYYGACVDAVAGESDTTNNCSSSVAVTVAEPQTSPDLSVGSPTVNDNSPETGGAFTLSATVSNDGDGAAAATTLRYYRSTDATITISDTSVGTDAVGALAASGTSAESISLTAPLTAGTYYYGACVDAVTDESDTTNNCSSSVAVTVAEPQTSPDLSVGLPTVNDNSPETGGAFTLSATVSNDGDGAAAATTLRYYRSTDATITTSDTSVGTDAVVALAASGTSAESISLTAPLTAGTYYYGACVDAVTDESDTTNNCSSSVAIAVEEESSGQPDLRIVGVSTFTPIDGVFSWNSHPILSIRPKLWRREFGCHDVALLPFDGRNDLRVGHGGWHGRSFCVGPFETGFGGDRPDRAVDARHLLLRRMRGRGGRGVGHHQQLFFVGRGHGDGATNLTGSVGGYANGE